MPKHTEKPSEFTAKMSEKGNNYSYEFSPVLSSKDVEKLPAHIKKFMAKNISPGFVFHQEFQNSMYETMTVGNKGQVYMEREEREAPHPLIVRLDISKQTLRSNVDRLFGMLQEAGFNLSVGAEKYPQYETGDPEYKTAVDDVRSSLRKRIS